MAMPNREPNTDLATRGDVRELKDDLLRELASKAEVERLRAELVSAISTVNGNLERAISIVNANVERLHTKIEGVDSRLNRRILRALVALTAIFSLVVIIVGWLITRRPG